jgi:putative glutamine amidotransferase
MFPRPDPLFEDVGNLPVPHTPPLSWAGSRPMRPLIGITTYAQEASWGVWRLPAALIPLDYVDAVERAGGRPVLIPPSEDGLEETLDALDGIVFSGGADVDPALYGAEAHLETDDPQQRRDAAEMALLHAALERDVPTLAVCRGVQLLNVSRGGDLVQHLPERVGHERHRETPGAFSQHPVEVRSGSRLAGVVGSGPHVTSHHHQSLGRTGEGLVETAWAEDGTVEAVEDPSRRFAIGVQWHPEASDDQALIEALVEEAQRYRAERGR